MPKGVEHASAVIEERDQARVPTSVMPKGVEHSISPIFRPVARKVPTSVSAHVSRGPSQDSPQFKPTVRAACGRCPVETLLGDGAFDAEPNHARARQRLGVRSTVFPLNRRNTGREWPKTRDRRQMVRRFRRKPRRSKHRRVSGQRWQIESGFSRQKRLLGSALRARKWVNQKKEIQLRVRTHNLMLLAAA